MVLFRLGYFSVIPDKHAADGSAFTGALTLFSQRMAQIAARKGLTGGILCEPPFIATVMEGTRRNVNEAFLRHIVDPQLGSCTLIGAEVIAQRAFTHWSAAPFEADPRRGAIRADMVTLEELTDFVQLAANDIMDVDIAS
ncbi:MAG: BLUF domain-containing protein [Labrys sp. (in: a-proteobacteria)]|jgi:hypothetical protein